MAGAALLERAAQPQRTEGDIVLRTVDGTVVVYDEVPGGKGRIEVRSRHRAGAGIGTPRRRRFVR